MLVLEGAVPTKFGGHACVVWNYAGQEVTFQQAVQELTAKAIATVCVGTCASFGGIPASGSNPTGCMGVQQFTGRPTINISGCPANPDWVVWAIVQLLTGTPVTLDEDGRPTALYSNGFDGATPEDPVIHDKCPRNPASRAPLGASFGENGHCLSNLGCRGPSTKSRCNGLERHRRAHAGAAASGPLVHRRQRPLPRLRGEDLPRPAVLLRALSFQPLIAIRRTHYASHYRSH